jgi:hypothetical protein
MKMFKKHMMVYANQKINNKINAGCAGTIVYVFRDDMFEVEFFDEKMNIMDLVSISGNQIVNKF